MKKLATLVLCALMLFSTVMPTTTLAKTKKCTHPKEVVKVVKKLGHKWSDWKITSKAKNKMVNIRRSCKRYKKVQKQTCPDVGYWGWY